MPDVDIADLADQAAWHVLARTGATAEEFGTAAVAGMARLNEIVPGVKLAHLRIDKPAGQTDEGADR